MKKLILFFVFSFFFFCIGQSRAYVTTAVKTDSLVYSSGQEIFIYFTIKNHGPDTLQFNWPTSCQAIYSIDGQKADLACYAVLTELTLYPDSSFTWVFKHTQEIFPIYTGTHILKVEVIDYEQYFAFNNFSTAFLKLTDQSKKICTEDSSFIKLTVVDDTLKFFWQTPALNSCLEPLWGGWLKADTFHLAMVDTGAPCDCDCENHFHLTADFASFPDGRYVLDFADGVYGYPIFDIGVVGIREEIIPGSVALFQNYPNPFNPKTAISYQLTAVSNVELTVYNILGQKVKTIVNKRQSAGPHSVIWDGTDNNNRTVSSGVYIYKLQAGNEKQGRKMLFLR